MSDKNLQFGDVDGNVNIIQGRMTAGGDIIAGNKTIIQNIIQQAAKQIVTAPYKFLASYDISDRDIFFGRKQVIEELIGEIPRHKSLLINGRSGSGKTSLINAGLIPRLAENGYVYVSFRDYHDPLRQLREHLRQHDTFKLDHADSLPLLGILQTLSRQQDSRVVLVFDQFERFFVGVSADLRTQFIQEFKVCLESGLSAEEMNVVFSIRQDFFGRLVDEFDNAIPTFFAESARYTLRPLSLAEAREAIVKPLKFVPNLFYDEGFMDDVLLPSLMGQTPDGQQIEPPHLQIVCNQLYEEVRKRHAADLESGEKPIFIGYDLYHDLGETQGILHNYLDDVVARMTGNNPDRMAIVRSILKLMIETVGTRKFVSLSDLAAGLPDVPQTELKTITAQLQNGRVVETRNVGEAARYSLSHEFMVEKVQSWYDEREMQRKKAQETLERGLAEWKSSQALLNEKQVSNIRKWLADDTLSAEAGQLLQQSQETYEREQCEKAERERRLWEEEEARRKAEQEYAEEQRQRAEEAEKHAAEQARSISRIKKLIVGLVVLLMVVMVATGAAVYAWLNQQKAIMAEHIARESEARQRERAEQREQKIIQAQKSLIYGYSTQGNYIEAVELLYDLGKMYFKQNKYREISNFYQDIIKAYPELEKAITSSEYAETHYVLGSIYDDQKRYSEAVREFEHALQYEFDNNEVRAGLLNSLAWILVEQDMDIDKGVQYAQQSLTFNPKNFHTMDTLALGYIKQGRHSEAVEILEQALKIKPDYETLHKRMQQAQEGVEE